MVTVQQSYLVVKNAVAMVTDHCPAVILSTVIANVSSSSLDLCFLEHLWFLACKIFFGSKLISSLFLKKTGKQLISSSHPGGYLHFLGQNIYQCFVLEIFSRFLCFCEIRFQNLWHHDRHCYIIEVILMLSSFEFYGLSK